MRKLLFVFIAIIALSVVSCKHRHHRNGECSKDTLDTTTIVSDTTAVVDSVNL